MGEGKFVGLQHNWTLQERPSSVEHIWQEVLQVVRERVEATKYATWFAPPSPYQARWACCALRYRTNSCVTGWWNIIMSSSPKPCVNARAYHTKCFSSSKSRQKQ